MGAISIGEQVFECLIRKFKGQMLFKSNTLYIIKKLLKCKDKKWSCYLDLNLWAKSYENKKLKLKKTFS
jgi:hypothetical protein